MHSTAAERLGSITSQPTVHETGEFNLQLFAYQTSVHRGVIEDILSGLAGVSLQWDVTLHDPSENEPHGRVVLHHDSFNARSFVISSRTDGHSVTYDVYHVQPTDILTVADDVSLKNALRIAVFTANGERKRQSLLYAPQRAVSAAADRTRAIARRLLA